MRILFHKWEYPPQGSGIGQYISVVSAALREQGHFVVIVTSRYPECAEIEYLENGLVYRIFDFAQIGSLPVAEKILEIAQTHQIDIIEGADHLGESYPLLRFKSRPPVCIKLHYNDVFSTMRYAQAKYFWQYAVVKLACIRQRGRLFAERRSMELADAITAPCQAIVDLAEQHHLSLPQAVEVIPNPVCLNYDWKNEESESPTILFVGRMDFGKGVDYLLRLLDCVSYRFPEIRLEIAGGDSYARGIGSIQDWLCRHGGNSLEKLVFLGHLDQEALNRAYQRAWVVIVPSRWDTFPNVVLESMARKKALVTSEVGGMPDMIVGTTNYSAQPDGYSFVEYIVRFLEDVSLRRKAGLSGFEKVRSVYSPKQIAEKQIVFFERVLSEK
ncbi:glycosyltransferase family 4 protein [Desulfogranum mediterraneum]|uniref:glycosyltransferase family 4 protein n=1 Tax=Desulfogranum mediterraneum TaxID=160661 RepID=UPI0003F5A068|nr:glycosyltransferase family 4 protein [Desulfogranum mediterraneum]